METNLTVRRRFQENVGTKIHFVTIPNKCTIAKMYEFEDITPTMPHNLCFVRKARTRYFDIKAMLTCYYSYMNEHMTSQKFIGMLDIIK